MRAMIRNKVNGCRAKTSDIELLCHQVEVWRDVRRCAVLPWETSLISVYFHAKPPTSTSASSRTVWVTKYFFFQISFVYYNYRLCVSVIYLLSSVRNTSLSIASCGLVNSRLNCSAESVMRLHVTFETEHGLTSAPTQYRLYETFVTAH